jgi:hypothetical protein
VPKQRHRELHWILGSTQTADQKPISPDLLRIIDVGISLAQNTVSRAKPLRRKE